MYKLPTKQTAPRTTNLSENNRLMLRKFVKINIEKRNLLKPVDIMIFSFYPTKPVGGMDGGMVVSNDKKRHGLFQSRYFT